MKSANALRGGCVRTSSLSDRPLDTHLSGDTSLNKVRFDAFTWERNDAVSTNWPTVLPNLSAAFNSVICCAYRTQRK